MTIPDWFEPEFQIGLEHAVQQEVSIISEFARIRTGASGESYHWNIVDPSEAHLETNNRLGRTIVEEVDGFRRVVRPEIVRKTSILDPNDKVFLGKQAITTSDVLDVHRMALARTRDKVLIDSAYNINYGGKDGHTPLALLESQKIPVDFASSGSAVKTGLTKQKLIRIRTMLKWNNVLSGKKDNDQLVMMVSPDQIEQLLNIDDLTDIQKMNVKALVDGEIDTALGIRFVTSNMLPRDADGNTRCLAYMKSGLNLFPWNNLKVRVTEESGRNFAIQVFTEDMYGACRSDEKKFVEVVCANI